MNTIDVGSQIAELFGGLWHVRHTPWFHRYIEVACRVTVPELPVLKAVVITEAESGDVRHGSVQSLVTRTWVADANGFRAVSLDVILPWAEDSNEAGDAGRLYSGWVKVHFFAEGDRVAVRGVFGPEVRFRMLGRFAVDDGELRFTDVRVPAPNDAFAFSASCPVREELELRRPRRDCG